MIDQSAAQPLPRTPEELTDRWLSEVLGREVANASVDHVIWGTATKIFLTVVFADAPTESVRLCVKGGFDERLAGFALEVAYKLEAEFFAQLAPKLSLRLPTVWHAGPTADSGVVIFDDLAAAGATFGEPTEPWSHDEVAAGLEQLAALHAQTWGQTRASLGTWIDVGATSLRATAPILLGAEHWAAQAALDGGPPLPDEAMREAIAAGFRRLWEFDDNGDLCVAHGDAHVGNTFRDVDGNPGFLDWQAVALGSWAHDVAYFIGGAMEIEVRRAHEHDLLLHYLDALQAGGGPKLGFDEAWLDVRRHALHGFLWAMTPPTMQPVERVTAMATRHLQHIEDHDALAALGL